MRTTTLSSGAEMPALGLGTWKSKPGEVGAAVEEAIRAGYRHIDCAAIYGNEAEIGQALGRIWRDKDVGRGDIWITSKLWNDAHRPEDVERAAKKTLDDLGLDRLDLYLMHWPVAVRPGSSFPFEASDLLSLKEIPLAETWSAMEALVDAGLCTSIGVSNFSAKKLSALSQGARIKPAVNQVEMHPYLRQPELLAACAELGVHVTAYSPLGSRDRANKAEDEPVLLEDPQVRAVADEIDASPAQVLIAWAIARGTSVIPKSTNPGRIRENFKAASIELSPSHRARLDALDRHRRYIDGSFWAKEGSPYTVESLWDE